MTGGWTGERRLCCAHVIRCAEHYRHRKVSHTSLSTKWRRLDVLFLLIQRFPFFLFVSSLTFIIGSMRIAINWISTYTIHYTSLDWHTT